jgi:hypothetical protein
MFIWIKGVLNAENIKKHSPAGSSDQNKKT